MASKGKRKRPKPTIANPLFCQWLQGWKEEAESKGWKSYHTYKMVGSCFRTSFDNYNRVTINTHSRQRATAIEFRGPHCFIYRLNLTSFETCLHICIFEMSAQAISTIRLQIQSKAISSMHSCR